MKTSRVVVGLVLATVLGVLTFAPSSAVTLGGGSVQGYAAEEPIDNGRIVILSDKDAQLVKLATMDDIQNMFGVSVDPNDLPIKISNEALKNETFVAVSGTYDVLVSTQAGEIKPGDFITLSSINGIAMNAGSDEVIVFGRAIEGFDGKGANLGTSQLKDTSGNVTQTVTIGSIPVTINIQRNPNITSTKTNLPDFLERIGQAIAEKEVSPIRMYLSLGITIVSLIAAIVIIYAGVRSGVISIGRNPMSKRSIFKSLFEVILTALLVLIIGLFAVYLLLKL